MSLLKHFMVTVLAFHVVLLHVECEKANQKDFREMGNPRKKEHVENIKDAQHNKPSTSTSTKTKANSLDQKRADIFLKRIVQKFLTRIGDKTMFLNYENHKDLEIPVVLTISLNEYNEMTDFVNGQGETRYQEIDAIFLKILKPAPDSGEFALLSHMALSDYIKVFLLSIMLATGISIFIAVIMKMVASRQNSFTQICIILQLLSLFSLAWTFLDLHKEATAKANNSRKEYDSSNCDSAGSKTSDGALGFMHGWLYGYRDKCEQLYIEAFRDPVWSVNPLDVFARSFAGLLFSQLPYIGDKMGQFLNNVMFVVPIWLRPILFLPVLVILIICIFGIRISTPFLTLESGGVRGRRPLMASTKEAIPGEQHEAINE